MYPEIPYPGLSWPITQHSGVLSNEVLDGLLNAGLLCNGSRPDVSTINGYLIEHGILTANYRADSNQADAWRDYQQILSEFGFIYSTRVSREIKLTPIAMAYLNGRLTYRDVITLQIMRYQYPNGHKSQLSPSLIESYGAEFRFQSYTEMQDANNILIRPAVVVWKVLFGLWQKNEQAILSLDEMQTYVARCTQHTDTTSCVEAIIESRQGNSLVTPLQRARRNMADWMKILNQTPLFTLSYDSTSLSLSVFSIRNYKLILDICNQMSDPTSFWYYHEENFKEDWFDFYGSFDTVTDWVIKAV